MTMYNRLFLASQPKKEVTLYCGGEKQNWEHNST